MEEITLDNIKIGHSGQVTRIGIQGPLKRRLIDMGTPPGVIIKVKKTAPMGDPIEIRLRGYELSIRRSEAKNINVRPLNKEEL